jgi:hypothetical protein
METIENFENININSAIRLYKKHQEAVKKYQQENPAKMKEKAKRYYDKLKESNPEQYKSMLEKKKEQYRQKKELKSNTQN